MINTTELKIAMLRKGYNNSMMANAIGRSETTFSYKLNNIRDFTTSEIKIVQKVLELTDGERDLIFFAPNVDRKSTSYREASN